MGTFTPIQLRRASLRSAARLRILPPSRGRKLLNQYRNDSWESLSPVVARAALRRAVTAGRTIATSRAGALIRATVGALGTAFCTVAPVLRTTVGPFRATLSALAAMFAPMIGTFARRAGATFAFRAGRAAFAVGSGAILGLRALPGKRVIDRPTLALRTAVALAADFIAEVRVTRLAVAALSAAADVVIATFATRP